VNLAQWIREQYAWLGFNVSTEGYDVAALQEWASSLWRWMQQATADALIMVESSGNPYAHRQGSQFYGMLQMGAAAAEDVGIPDQRVLNGNPDLALNAFWDYQRRYIERTQGAPVWMAVLWHDGPGNLQKIMRQLEAGASVDAALGAGTPAIREYVDRYQQWMKRIAGGYDVQARIDEHVSQRT